MASISTANGTIPGASSVSETSNTKSKGKGAVSAETYGRLDTESVADEVWMLRIPPKLAKVWEDAPEGTVLGDLVFTKGGSVEVASSKNAKPAASKKKIPPSFEVHVNEELADAAAAAEATSTQPKSISDLPLTYSIQAMTKRVPVLHPFTRSTDGSVELHGTVTRSANLQMKPQDERYRQMCRNRLLQQNVNSDRYVRPVDANELSVRKTHVTAALKTSAGGGFGNAVQSFGTRLLEATQSGGTDVSSSRKRKYEGQTTQSVVFEMFSEKPYWTVKEMRSVCGRPEKELRSVLADIAEFHRSGEHKGSWSLRSEFQKQDGK